MHYGLWFNKDGFGMLKHRQKIPPKIIASGCLDSETTMPSA